MGFHKPADNIMLTMSMFYKQPMTMSWKKMSSVKEQKQ